MFSILYVDDEAALLELGKLFLERDGDFHVDTTVSAVDALEAMKSIRYDAIVSDYQMPGMDGIAFLKTVRSIASDKSRVPVHRDTSPAERRRPTPGDIPFILFTGRGREEVVIEAINSGVDFYLQKGGEPTSQFMELGHKIRQAIRRKRAEDSLYENEERLRFALEGASDGLWDVDLLSGDVYLSPRGCEMLGYTFEELSRIGSVWNDLVNPLDMPARESALEDYKQGKTSVFEVEQRLRTKSGEWKWVLSRGKIVERDAAGIPVRMTGTNTDITERKQAEEELRASYEQIAATEEELRGQYDEISRMVRDLSRSEEQYRSVIESVPVGMHFYHLEADGRLVFSGANPAADTILGIPHKTLVGKTIEEAFPSLTSTEIPEQYREVARTGSIWHTEQVDYKDTQIRGAFSVWAFRIAPGQMAAAFLDITDLKKTQSALEASGREYRAILDTIQDIFYRTDARGTLVMISPSGADLLGYTTTDEMIGRPGTDFYAYPADREKLLDAIRKNGSVSQMEVTLKRRDGTNVEVSTSTHAIYDAGGTFAGVEGIFRDMTRFHQAREELRESEEKYRVLVQHIQDGVFLTQDEFIIYCNDVFAAMAGYSRDEVIGKPVEALVAPEDRNKITGRSRSRLKGNPEPELYEFSVLHKDGITRVPVRMSVGVGMYRGKKAIIGTLRKM